MKHRNVTILLLILMSMVGAKALGSDIVVDNSDGKTIYYNYINDGQELEVTYQGSSPSHFDEYKGIIRIPEEVTYNGVTRQVTKIGMDAFNYCSTLACVSIPKTIKSFGFGAFFNIGAFGIVIENISSWCNIVFTGYKNNPLNYANKWYVGEYPGVETNELTIPKDVNEIGAYAFYNCRNLTSITIEENVTNIGSSAFGFPKNEGGSLAKVISLNKNPVDIAEDAFSEKSYKNATLYIPAGTINKYKVAKGWNKFIKMEEIIDSNPIIVTANDSNMMYGDFVPDFAFSVEGGTLTGTPSFSCEATSASPVGTYPISISVGTIVNPNVTYINGTLTIEKASLNISAGNYTKKQGEPLPEFTLMFSGFKNNETRSVLTKQPIVSCEATVNSSPGEYPIIVSDAEAQNYEISYTIGKLIVTAPLNPKYKLIYIVDGEVYKTYEIEFGSTITPEAEPTKEGYTFSGWSEIPETMPDHDVTVTGTFTQIQLKCATPTIKIENGLLKLSCETPGVTYVTSYTAEGVFNTKNGNEVVTSGPVVCHISVYATKKDYQNSDVATIDVELFIGKKGDVNQDGVVTITDAVSVVNIILNEDGTISAPVMESPAVEAPEVGEPE